jgi:hypothetical protein
MFIQQRAHTLTAKVSKTDENQLDFTKTKKPVQSGFVSLPKTDWFNLIFFKI